MDAFEGGQSGTWDQVTAAKDGDVVWVSVAYPVWTDAVARLLAARPRPHVVVLSPAPDQTEGLQAINLGARGYCHLYAVPELMQDVASGVAQGGLWVGPELVDRIVAAARERKLTLDKAEGFESGTGIGVRGTVGTQQVSFTLRDVEPLKIETTTLASR